MDTDTPLPSDRTGRHADPDGEPRREEFVFEEPEEQKDPLWKRFLSLIFTLAIVGGTLYLWPAPLGGSTRIIVVSGVSMEPTYDLGDLVLVREQSTSQIGDIVVFEVPEGQTGAGLLVIHRVLKIDDEGFFITQGDNRSTPDEWQLTEDDIVGQPLAHLPRGGKFLEFVQQLWVIALIVGVAVMLLLWPDEDEDELDEDDVDDGEDEHDPVLVASAGSVERHDEHEAGIEPTTDPLADDTDELDRVLLSFGASIPDLHRLDDADATERAERTGLDHDATAELDRDPAHDLDLAGDIDDDVMADAMAWLDAQLDDRGDTLTR